MKRSLKFCVLVLAGVIVSLAAQAGDPEWTECDGSDDPYASDMECTVIEVPVNWSEHNGRKLSLKVARLPAADPEQREGVVVVLAGGPGGSGIPQLSAVAEGLTLVRERFDLVAHEPRTRLAYRLLPESCWQRAGPVMSIPTSAEEYQRMIEPIVAGVQQCRRDDETRLVDHLDGLSQARDVDAIRSALGEQQLSLTSFSYGGIVAATYAREFPERVRAVFVDGSFSHPDGWQGNIVHFEVVEEQYDRFVEWCEATTECALHGEDVRRIWQELVTQANHSPFTVSTQSRGEAQLTGAHLHFMPGLDWPRQDFSGWLVFSEAIQAARNGDVSAFARESLPPLDRFTEPGWIAMSCSDGSLGKAGYDHFAKQLRAAREAAPNRYGMMMLAIVCGAWPVPHANPPAPLPVGKLPPFLGAATSTDYAITRQLMDHIPGSVTIRVDRPGHGVYIPIGGYPANRCVLDHLNRYLLELKLPQREKECPVEGVGR